MVLVCITNLYRYPSTSRQICALVACLAFLKKQVVSVACWKLKTSKFVVALWVRQLLEVCPYRYWNLSAWLGCKLMRYYILSRELHAVVLWYLCWVHPVIISVSCFRFYKVAVNDSILWFQVGYDRILFSVWSFAYVGIVSTFGEANIISWQITEMGFWIP
jgi:hypothetical protein